MVNTKKSLIFSALSLLLCCALLIGTTFAWFTDSVTNTGNKIQAGTLDVALFQKTDTLSDEQKADPELDTTGEYTDISDSATPVFSYDLWEPGYSAGATLKVVNNGSLALKYEFALKITDSKTGAELDPELDFATGNLADVIYVYLLDSCRQPTEDDVPAGTLAELTDNSTAVFDSGILAAGTSGDDINIVVKMSENAGNEYQGAAISFDIVLRATQAPVEEDGFGDSTYDADADGTPDNPTWGEISTGRVTVPVAPDGQDTVIKDSYGITNFIVPADAIEDGAQKLTLNIEEIPLYDGVEVGEDQTATTYDITIEGLKEDNDIPVTVTFFIGKGLTGVKMYHYDTLIEDADYDIDTGYVTFTSTSFSPFTIVTDRTLTVKTEAELLSAVKADGMKVVLANDITVSAVVTVPEGTTTSIDLGGYTIYGRGIRNYGTITAITNGSIVADAGYGIDNRANIGTLNCNVTSKTSDAISNGTGTWIDEVYVSTYGVIDEIAGGYYHGYPETYGSSIVGSCGLYNGSLAVVKLISGGHFQGSSVAFRSYNSNGILSVTGGFFDSPYMDANGRTFCDAGTIGNVFYNSAPLSVSGGTWYNVGTKINSKLADGYELVKGDICEMTSYKNYVRYDSETKKPAHWIDDENGAVYYYYTVEKAATEVSSAADFGKEYVNTSTGDELIEYLCNGGEFVLADNITLTNTVYFYADTVIDLNGKTITKDFGGNLCAIGENITVTFINGSIVVPESAKQGVTNYGDFWYQRNFYTYDQTLNLNFEGVTISLPDNDDFAAFKGYIRNSGGLTVNITGANVTGVLFEDFDSAVNVNCTDCTLNGETYPAIK